jgi:hypothetical protein
MVTKDESRWNLIEAIKEYRAAQKELNVVDVLPEDFIKGKSIQEIVAPLTSKQFLERMERFDNAWARYCEAWGAFLRFSDE